MTLKSHSAGGVLSQQVFSSGTLPKFHLLPELLPCLPIFQPEERKIKTLPDPKAQSFPIKIS
jgi:hypothetical protein